MLQLFINGPPGAGKTTICKLLCKEFGLEHVSTGDLLRENILARTDLGSVAKQCISSKTLVPDHVVVDMVAEKILKCNQHGQGWVLDGFPRTVDQSSALRRKQIFPCVVIILELSEKECVQRLIGRRFDATTGNIYHMSALPRDPAVLARLTKRSDDSLEKLPPRFEAYRTYGEKINALFHSVSHRVDTSKSTADILEDISALLHAIRPVARVASCSSSLPSFASPLHGLQNNNSSIRNNQNPLHVTDSSKYAQLKKQLPQKIDEEEEEEDDDVRGTDDLQQFNYECDDDLHPHSPKRIEKDVSRLNLEEKTGSEVVKPTLGISDNNNDCEDALSPSALTQSAPSDVTIQASPACLSNNSAIQPPSTSADFAKFQEMLLDGFEVLKHGRRGSPHTRLIYTDMEFKRIFWQKPTRDHKTKKAKLDQSVVLADVVQVVRGMKTDVLKRSGDVTKYERYLSLVADDRTLDMEFATEAMCEFALKGFEQLLHGSN